MLVNPIELVKRYLRKKKELQFFRDSSNEEIFTHIYQHNKWGHGDTRSGKGSSLDRTVRLREQLPDLISQLNITSLLDIPCGDFYWMKQIELPLQQYIGADIVASLAEENTNRYGSDNKKFLQLDLMHDELPAADAILCRECLVHLSFEDIAQAIKNIRRSDATYLLTTHFPELGSNTNIVTGKHRPLNMQLSPFFWPAPIAEIVEDNVSTRRGKKCLSVWRVSDLPELV
jgi:hypothetical protein